MTAEPIKVGDQLWLVPFRNFQGTPRFVTVEKIGRVWGYFETDSRFLLETLGISGFQGVTLHRSREVYEAKVRTNKAWNRLRTLIDRKYEAPPNVTRSEINQAAELLGFTITPEATT